MFNKLKQTKLEQDKFTVKEEKQSKGAFPYSYMTSFDKLDETKLTPKEAFFNNLSKEDITDEAYRHACNVWESFNCKSLLQYQNICMNLNVCLLADVFEGFRNQSIQQYRLDPAHFNTAPFLSWSAWFN